MSKATVVLAPSPPLYLDWTQYEEGKRDVPNAAACIE
jgi:hypothetical protein